MNKQSRAGGGGVCATCLCLCFGFGSLGYTQASSAARSAVQKEAVVKAQASGTFEVKLTPQAADEKTEDASLGRITIEKQFHGDLEGTSKGQMLTAGTGAKGSSGGYVAIEKVSGTLHGRSGSFVLQHSGTMTRGVPQLVIAVVPDSGTGQLAGCAGNKALKHADREHSYDFEYTR